ncbi:MAG: cobalamin biosynthesis protein CobW [Euryarchaeota archaeon]|nr:cobalamin biosynthesis protein CobW [Euryarchaeota archaeon]|tara:strand:+ start:827 stop:2014 length:1188 start_codon:yes stop_codon:yes gene_type:complete
MAKVRRAKRKIPVTVLTGFLGSGKTTLLNHILSSTEHKMKFAVIENEFGDVGIDENILVESSEESVIEVMNGCICCTVRGDLTEALDRLYDRIRDFDGVLIETTGLADPAPVAQTFFVDDRVTERYKLDGIITVVDAKHAIPHIDEEKPEGIENEAVEQLAFADRIMLNKIDLVSEEEIKEVEKKIKSINAFAPIYHTQNSIIDPKTLIDIGSFDLERTLKMDPEFLDTDAEHEHDQRVTSISSKFAGALNVNKLERWIGDLMQNKAEDLFRYKGVLAVKGMDQKYVFQGVHMLFSGVFSEEVAQWRKGEKRECRFVFIGRDLDHAALEAGLMECRAEDLRFNVGDMVYANIGEFTEGKILKCWDQGNPYRVEIQNEEKSNVWVPIDSDEFVRAK